MTSFKDKYDVLEYECVVYFFEYMLNNNFMRILEFMADDISYSDECLGYAFASGCDEEDIENGDYFSNGVLFFLNEAEEIVGYKFFYDCLKTACDIYLADNTLKRDVVNNKLDIIRKRYNL